MRISKWIIAAAATSLITGGLLTSSHAANLKANRPTRGQALQRVKEKLGITDEQAAQIKAVLKAEKDNITNLASRLHEARAELRSAIHAKDATEASVRAASAKVAVVEADVAVERLKVHGQIAPILTDEQRAKLSEIETKMDEFIDRAIGRAGERLSK